MGGLPIQFIIGLIAAGAILLGLSIIASKYN